MIEEGRSEEEANPMDLTLRLANDPEKQESLHTFLMNIHKCDFHEFHASNTAYAAKKLGLDTIDADLIPDIEKAYAIHFLNKLKHLFLLRMDGKGGNNPQQGWTVVSHIGHMANEVVCYLRHMKKDVIADVLLECRLLVYEYCGSYIIAAEQRIYTTDHERETALARAAIEEKNYEHCMFGVKYLGKVHSKNEDPILRCAERVIETFDADPELHQDPDIFRKKIAQRFPYSRFGLVSALEDGH